MSTGKEREREKESSKEKEKERETSNTNSNTKTVLRNEYTIVAMTVFFVMLISISFSRKLALYFSISNSITNKEVQMTESTLRDIMRAERLSVREGPDYQRIAHFERTLKIVLPPRSQSDRTCYRNIAKWVQEKYEKGLFSLDEIFSRVIDYALEATSPGAKNPPAVFMSILKKELNYPK